MYYVSICSTSCRENFTAGKSTTEQCTTFVKLSRLANRNVFNVYMVQKTIFYIRLDKQLTDLERRHKVVSRWHVQDPQYIAAKCVHLRETQQRVRASLWATITRRQFLLKMKAKYGGKLKCNEC